MTTNAEILRKYEIKLSLTVKQILVFALSTNFAREVKNLSPNYERIAERCSTS